MAQQAFDSRVEFRGRTPTVPKKRKMQNGEWRESRRRGEPMNSGTGYNPTGSWRPPSTHYGAQRGRIPLISQLPDPQPANNRHTGDGRNVFRTTGGVDEHNRVGERAHYGWGSRDRGSSNDNFKELQKLREQNGALLEELEESRHTNGILKRQLDVKNREGQQRNFDIQLLEIRLKVSEERNGQLQRELRTARFGAFGPRKRIKKVNAFGNDGPARPKQRPRFVHNNKSKQSSPINKRGEHNNKLKQTSPANNHGDVDLRVDESLPDQRQQQLSSKSPASSPMRQLLPSTSWNAEAPKQPFALDAVMEEILKPSKTESDAQEKGKSSELLAAEVEKILAELGAGHAQ